MTKHPTIAELTWTGDLKFSATIRTASFTLDSAGVAGPSPVGALAAAVAGCMCMDVVHILTRGRHALRAMSSQIEGERAPEDPKRLTRLKLRITLDSDAPASAVERAIQLSREKYCSVWHSMRQDIEFVTSFDVRTSGTPSSDA